MRIHWVLQVISDEEKRAQSDPSFFLKAASSQAKEAVVSMLIDGNLAAYSLSPGGALCNQGQVEECYDDDLKQHHYCACGRLMLDFAFT